MEAFRSFSEYLPMYALIGIAICLGITVLDVLISRCVGGLAWEEFKLWWRGPK